MALCSYTLSKVTSSAPNLAWSEILEFTWNLFSYPLPTDDAADAKVLERDEQLAHLEAVVSGAAWELWNDFEQAVPKASQGLLDFWRTTPSGKAILILDGLSLRECPWLLTEAGRRGFRVHRQECRASELPAETTAFAKSLGLSQRSLLENNGATGKHGFPGAFTECCDLPWRDCTNQLQSQPGIVFWHHWPDNRLHDNSVAGAGLPKHIRETRCTLISDEFWAFVERLATGRRVVITSDHGYAACGQFPDIADKEQAAYAKAIFKSQRFADDTPEYGPWVPPIDLRLATDAGDHRYVLGRRKWRMPSGYPTLQHGGLSLLEVLVPFIELTT